MGFNSNIFQTKRVMNAQTVNQNRFTLRFLDLQNLLFSVISPESDYKNRRPSLYYKIKELHDSMIWHNDEGGYTQVESNRDTPNLNQNHLADVLELSLLSATLPTVQLETQSLSKFNDSIKAITKFGELDDLTCSFYDYIDGSSSAIMEAWRSIVGDKATGAISYREEYVLDQAIFYVYGPDAPGLGPPDGANFDKDKGWVDGWVQAYKIVNIYPTQVNLGEHSMENGEARKVEVTFSIDNIYQIGARHYDYESGEYIGGGTGETYYERELSEPFPQHTS